MKPKLFFATHPVFSSEEFVKCQNKNFWTRRNTLAHYSRNGRIVSLRRGLFAVVPVGTSADNYVADPYIIASKLANDAVLSFHTALEIYGRAYSTFEQYTFYSAKQVQPYNWDGCQYVRIPHPKALATEEQQNFGIETVERSGIDIRVTSLERTMVDLLHRPKLGGGWEEVYRSLESVEYLDLDCVVEYVALLGNKATAAKTGYYLQTHSKELMVEEKHLEKLRHLCPKQPHYLERSDKGKLIKEWNLIVPDWIAYEQWKEVT